MGSIFAVPIQREWCDIESMEKFLVSEWPETIIELGTGTGGFSVYLAAYCAAHGFTFHTWDTGTAKHAHQKPQVLPLIKQLGGEVHTGDVFANVTQISQDLKGKAFLYCDNGDKPKELQTFAPFIPLHSFIGVHDYGTEVQDTDLELDGFSLWNPEAETTNRFLQRVA